MKKRTFDRAHSGEQGALQSILDQIDREDGVRPRTNRRRSARHTYRNKPVIIRITQPGGGTTQCPVAARDLSTTGVSFLYRGFLYTGTEIRFALLRRTGGIEAIDGTVAWCKHIVGQHHLVGVRFNEKIDLKFFIEHADWPEEEPATALQAKVLLIDDQHLDRMLFEHHAKKTALSVTSVADGPAALKAIAGKRFDIILCDLNLGEQHGEDLIQQIHDAGFKGNIIALVAEASSERLSATQAAGVTAIVQKPYDPHHLLGMIASTIANPHGLPPADAIYSDLAQSPDGEALLANCIQQIRALCADIRLASSANDLSGVRNHCQTLVANGSGFGFPELTSAAKRAVAALDASMSVQQSTDEIQRLEATCRRLSPAPRPTS